MAKSVCTGETYKNVVKMTFPRGASLEDPAALKALVRAAVRLNSSRAR